MSNSIEIDYLVIIDIQIAGLNGPLIMISDNGF